MNNILQLQTSSPTPVSTDGMPKYKKEIIKVGKYVKASTNQTLDVDLELLNHWKNMFDLWTNNGNKVPVPLGHEREGMPEANAGWVLSMYVEENSLYAVIELLDDTLALTTDVSVCIESKVIDGKGVEYSSIITHVALCTDPVVPGLSKFEKLSFSLKGNNMEFIEKIAKKLGLSKNTEDAVLEAIEKTEMSAKNNELAVKVIKENREIKLSNLVKGGLITPAIKDMIAEKYVNTIELSSTDNGFDFLYDVLSKNKPVDLKEISGIQSVELSNKSVDKISPLKKAVNKSRVAAGLKEVE